MAHAQVAHDALARQGTSEREIPIRDGDAGLPVACQEFRGEPADVAVEVLRRGEAELVERGLVGEGDALLATHVDGVADAFQHGAQHRSVPFGLGQTSPQPFDRIVLFHSSTLHGRLRPYRVISAFGSKARP